MTTPLLTNPVMINNLLFEHFATLATAPDGIPRLRELILQLAVQGKLGTQDPGDEPASVLLKKIRKEKDRLVKKGEIRQERSLDPINHNELSHALPTGWEQSKLGDYCHVIMGQSPESKYYNDNEIGLPFYQGKTEFGKLFPTPKIWCEVPQKIALKDDILISVRAPVGPTNICQNESCIGRGLAAIRSLMGTSHFFLLYSLRASEKIIAEKGVGSTFSAISKKDLDNFVLAIPPLSEQHRIVVKVDRLMALCDELEARQQQERAGCLRLGTASLTALQNAESPEEFEQQWAQMCEVFEMIFDCPENVVTLRQTILQLAVQGRLVRQEPGDEPASQILYNKIIELIETNEIPYKLPHGWIGTRCASICEKDRLITYGVIKLGADVRDGIPVLRSSDVKFLHINAIKIKRIDPSIASQYQRTFLHGGEIVINVRGTLGGIAVVPKEMKGYNISREVAVIPLIRQVSERYIAFAIASPFCQNWLSKNTKGIAYSGINIADLKQLPIPLPPLAEQHRIVAKVDALMASCDELEARLKERAGVQERFAVAVGKQVTG